MGSGFDRSIDFAVHYARLELVGVMDEAGFGVLGGQGHVTRGFAMAEGKKIGGKLAVIGVDAIKNTIFNLLQHGHGIRCSRSLEPVYFGQLASQRPVLARTARQAL